MYFTLLNSSLTELDHLSIAGEKLEVVNLEWRFNSFTGKSLKISTPNLKYFTWKGIPTNDNCLGNLMNLEGAQLFLEPKIPMRTYRWQFMVLYEQGCLPTCFSNICRLCMYVSNLKDDLVPAFVSLLRGMPNLKILSVKSSPNSTITHVCGFDAGYWESQNLIFIHHLLVAEIELLMVKMIWS